MRRRSCCRLASRPARRAGLSTRSSPSLHLSHSSFNYSDASRSATAACRHSDTAFRDQSHKHKLWKSRLHLVPIWHTAERDAGLSRVCHGRQSVPTGQQVAAWTDGLPRRAPRRSRVAGASPARSASSGEAPARGERERGGSPPPSGEPHASGERPLPRGLPACGERSPRGVLASERACASSCATSELQRPARRGGAGLRSDATCRARARACDGAGSAGRVLLAARGVRRPANARRRRSCRHPMHSGYSAAKRMPLRLLSLHTVRSLSPRPQHAPRHAPCQRCDVVHRRRRP